MVAALGLGVRFTLRVFGLEVVSLDVEHLVDFFEADESDATPIGGGAGHNFERDASPLDPADHYGEWEDRAGFGFGGKE